MKVGDRVQITDKNDYYCGYYGTIRLPQCVGDWTVDIHDTNHKGTCSVYNEDNLRLIPEKIGIGDTVKIDSTKRMTNGEECIVVSSTCNRDLVHIQFPDGCVRNYNVSDLKLIKKAETMKVGDKIRVNEKNNTYDDCLGEIIDTTSLHWKGRFRVKFAENTYGHYAECNLELVKDMTKGDLKTGMIVRLRCGEECILFKDEFITKGNACIIKRDRINNDLSNMSSYHGSSQFDIVEVFDHEMKSLWKRPVEVKEISLKEIANKFDIPIDQLRIKE